jgi:hypothetical protein
VSETFELKQVPIFSVGTWNRDVYSEQDLDHMVAAFGQVGFDPPMKLGHDASQPLAQSDGMPAIGWVRNLRRIGDKLYCDLTDLPKQVYQAIKRRAYNRVSAEIYWDYSCNGKTWPRVVKALSLLGADIPAVTSLAALETLYDGEQRPFKRYDMGMMDGSAPSTAQWSLPVTVNKKDKAVVHYRAGGEDANDDGLMDCCGNCEFFCGPSDPKGTNQYIACCSLVEGECASGQVCDLYEPDEAFQIFGQQAERRYIIEQQGDKWVLISESTGKVLGTHSSEAEAQAQEKAIQISKAKNNMQSDGELGPDTTPVGASAPTEGAHAMADGQTPTVEALQAQIAELTNKNQELSDTIQEHSTRVTELSQKETSAQQRVVELEKEKAELAERNRVTEKESWFSSLTSESNLKILPVERPIVEHLYDTLSGGQVKAYSQNGKELSNLDALKSLFESRKPGTFLFKELSSGEATETAGQPGTLELLRPSEAKAEATKQAKQYMKDKNEKVFSVALKAIYDANPDLKDMAAGITPQGQAKQDAGAARMGRMFKK